MKLSQAGFETNKIENLGDAFAGQELLLQTGQLVQYSSGIFAFGHIPLRVMRKVESVIRSVLDEYGCIEVSMPILQPETLWKESGRWDEYIDAGVMLTVRTDKGNYSIAPTAEEAITNFAKGRVKSYKSLPVTYYQIGAKFRNEIRNRGYLLRGKDFNMMDAYSFDTTEENLDKTYKNIKSAYMEIFKRLDLPVIPVSADSGSIGGDNSEEFMFIHPVGEDKIYVNKKTGKAYNVEVLEKYGITDLSEYDEKRAVEFGHIFQIGKKKYSETMNATFVDTNGKQQHFWMGCYGIGVSRLVALIYENSVIKAETGEVRGISLPATVAPYKVQIIAKQDNADKVKQALELYNYLNQNNVPCILDDRDITLGAKIQDVKKLGTPFMAILGDKAPDGKIEIEETANGKKTLVTKEELKDVLS